ncbi:MAG: phenylacetic acid degradation bifunctional protein PaaZ [Crocinitomicaceae bacterium]|nr:phenylacetic acid degradation bifunctional protein PaaZ [Crocinitomicaceae bacterium]|tara:strand:+ start:17020 stop:19071 length:2052 start_codon:yes stop_codon:yes gene_type:complete
MQRYQSYVQGKWIDGEGVETELYNSITGDQIGEVSSVGFDYESILSYGRKIGGEKLRKMTFQERGRMLKALAFHLLEKKERYYQVSALTGATKVDSWIDIEGGIGNLFANASLRRQFPDLPYNVDGVAANLSKQGSFIGHHIQVPKRGIAIHINAFNFPIWGMLEKIATNFMAGVPAVVKPSEYTCFLTQVMVRDIIDSKILPEGSLQLICGLGRGLIDYAISEDVITFTGSSTTGKLLKASPRIIEESIPFNLEADSLNASVLGRHAIPGTNEFDLFIKETVKEITIKAGQKCTAIRRIIVPEKYIDEVQKEIINKLDRIIIGNPIEDDVRMGALATKIQVERVRKSVEQLSQSQKIVFGDIDNFKVKGASKEKGAFFPPILFRNDNPFKSTDVHNIEAFGPVSTIIPYKNIDDAIELSRMGKGSLVSSIVTPNDQEGKEFVLGAASLHGRILVLNNDSAKESTGHGSPMPLLTHGGPGRAGGGEEMGGKRGIMHYMQRTSIQGHPTTITKITEQFQVGAKMPEANPHVFRQHFEELEVGDTVFTHKHTVTVGDITNFANVSGDNFYAHMDETSLEGTIFEKRVAHGYFLLSKAAGLFVDPKKGPVLLNYGIDEARFTKPVYPGATVGVRFTVKEKIDQEKRDENDIAKGIVKFLVDMYDETGDTVALATILTMVKKIDQSK